jgi:hypothetical protein
MIGQGQNKTQIHTRKKGWSAPARRTHRKKQREKGKGDKEGETEVVGENSHQ